MTDQSLDQSIPSDEHLAADGSEFTAAGLVRIARAKARLILGFALIVAIIAVAPRLTAKYRYKATASFTTRNSDASRAALTGLATSFGVAIPSGNQAQSPQFFADLLTSRAVILRVADLTFTDSSEGGARKTIKELYELKGANAEQEVEMAVDSIVSSIRTEVNRNTGVVRVYVTTPWRSVSREMTTALLAELNSFNLRVLQTQASAERRFAEERLAIAKDSLRRAENRMEAFLRGNRIGSSSPELSLARDRLQRDVVLAQHVTNALASAVEDARIREVRDTPVISIVDSPSVQYRPEARGRLKRALYGFVLGAVAALVLLAMRDSLRRKQAAGDPLAKEVDLVISEIRRRLWRQRE